MNKMGDLLKKRMVDGHLFNVLSTPEAHCSFCESAHLVRHVHIIVRDGTVINPFEGLPESAPVSCSKCSSTLGEFILCAQCRTVAYCGLKCQFLSWPSHRSECSPDANLIVSASKSEPKPALKIKHGFRRFGYRKAAPETESEPEPEPEPEDILFANVEEPEAKNFESMPIGGRILQIGDALQSSSKKIPPNSPNDDATKDGWQLKFAGSIFPRSMIYGDNQQKNPIICKLCGSGFVQLNRYMQHLESQCQT